MKVSKELKLNKKVEINKKPDNVSKKKKYKREIDLAADTNERGDTHIANLSQAIDSKIDPPKLLKYPKKIK